MEKSVFVAPRDKSFEANVRRDEAHDVKRTATAVLFWGGWPSQWYPSQFRIGDVVYSCAEQYMMAAKARLFGDGDALSRILRSKHPRAMKEAGRAVRDFDARRWDVASMHAVYRANLAKFSQDGALGAALLDTDELPIGEASPEDDLWGLGIGVKQAVKLDPKDWPGRNLLGHALMHVRASLRGRSGAAEVTDRTRDPHLVRPARR